MTKRHWTSVTVAAMLLVAALAYLRDPPWLIRVTSGLGEWQTDSDGTPYRWTAGHASFFVPSSAEFVTLRLRAPKDDPRDWPVTATISIDDRPADAVKVDAEAWSALRLRLPPPGERSLRRIDVKVDRVRSGNRGVQIQIDGS